MTAVATPQPRASPAVRVGLAAGVLAAVAALTVVLAVLAAAFSGAAAPFLINDPGPVVRWGLVVAHCVTDLAAAVTIGALVLAAVALPVTTMGRRSRAHRPALSLVAGSATLWAAGSLALLVLTYADALGEPVGGADVLSQLAEYARDVPAGQGLAFTAVLTAVIGLVAAGATGLRTSGLLAVLAFAALVPASLAGHAAGTGDHDTAVTAIGLHLAGVTLWLGGQRLQQEQHQQPAAAVRRYSTLAGWCFAAVALSGVRAAWLQLPGVSGLASRYGVLVLAKAALLVLLGLAGLCHRRLTLGRFEAGVPGAFLRLALAEVLLMAVAAR